MEDDKIILSVSIIDYIGVVNNGVSLLLSVIILDEIYEVGYWFNKKGNTLIMPDDKMLKKLNVKSIYDYEYIDKLITLIYASIDKKEEILNEFIKE